MLLSQTRLLKVLSARRALRWDRTVVTLCELEKSYFKWRAPTRGKWTIKTALKQKMERLWTCSVFPRAVNIFLKNSMSHYVPRPLWSLKVAIWENKPQIQFKGTEKKGSVLHCEHHLNKILVHITNVPISTWACVWGLYVSVEFHHICEVLLSTS